MQILSDTAPVSVRFTDLGLSEPLLRAVAGRGYEIPTPIQAAAIPAVLAGRDVMAAAQTGTGKTAGFTLPILHRLSAAGPVPRGGQHRIRALIVTPTRELAAQVEDSVKTYGGHLPLRSAVVFGGVGINPQIARLRHGVDILVATPGRLLDLHGQGAVRFDGLEVLVLDEADRMLDMGFIHDIRRILALLPKKRQNLMFSATFSEEIRELARGLVNDPVEIAVSPRNSTVDAVSQWVCPVDKDRKSDLLIHLIDTRRWRQVLVFCRTKHGANRLAQKLEKSGIDAMPIHGNKSQNARTKALGDFKAGQIRVLVATDIAARGLDIVELPHVVNFELPNVPEDYIHRIGRTGRAGNEGEAVSLVCAEEAGMLRDIEKLIRRTVERRMEKGFEPTETEASVRSVSPVSPRGGSQGYRGGAPGGSRGGNRRDGRTGDGRGRGGPRAPRSGLSGTPRDNSPEAVRGEHVFDRTPGSVHGGRAAMNRTGAPAAGPGRPRGPFHSDHAAAARTEASTTGPGRTHGPAGPDRTYGSDRRRRYGSR